MPANQKTEAKPSAKMMTANLLQYLELWHAAVGVSLLAIIGLSMPWVWADDFAKPHNAVGIMMHYPTAHDKWYLTRTTPIGSLISVFAPAAIIVSVLTTSAVILMRQKITVEAASGAAFTILMTAFLLWGCKEILDPDLPRIGPFNAPESGLTLVILSHLAIIAMYGYRQYEQRAHHGVHKQATQASYPETATPAGPDQPPEQEQSQPATEPSPQGLETGTGNREGKPPETPRSVPSEAAQH